MSEKASQIGFQENPCISCGACCAYFRVSFYWAESDEAGGVVPQALTEQVTPFLSCMSGTNARASRCVALEGEIGKAVSCSIYLNRPTPCREFDQSGLNGITNEACDRARARYGMPPLEVVSLNGVFLEELSAIMPASTHVREAR